MDNQVKDITSRDVDFAKWYTDVVKKADLVDYTNVKGSMVIRPYGYAIWENMQSILDKEFKRLGHENVQMPMFIPESLLNVEKDHVEGFAPEVAWVTYGGKEKLDERMCVRPTSETLFCDHFKKIVKSYRDLPVLYNQWCTIVRWEKTTRPFLRSREILWQEGHTLHATSEEAMAETLRMLHVYEDFQRNYLAMPVIVGRKTEKEKFAGAEATYTIEAMMYDGVALQNGTSHYFGTGFAHAFGIEFLDKDNKLKTPFQTSWGCTTRMIGGLIMTHSDDRGLVLPPKIAPTKVIVIPIGKDIDEYIDKVLDVLNKNDITNKVDRSDKTPGFKFAEAEVKGYPVRIEVGARDIKNGHITLVRRDTREKITCEADSDIASTVSDLLDTIQKDMYQRALERREKLTFEAHNLDDVRKIMDTQPGFIKAMWCGDEACELKMKEIKGTKSRCILEDEKKIDDKCVVCGKDAKHLVVWGIQY